MAFFGELPLDTDNAVGGGGWASSICLYTFALIANVGLVNLLIAMFSETYSEFSAKSESEYAYRKVVLLYIQRHIEMPIPPPFSLPFALWGILMNEWCPTCMSTKERASATRLTPAGARAVLADESSSSRDLVRTESDPRDGTLLVETFLRQRALAAANTYEKKREHMQTELVSRLDGLAMRLERVETEVKAAQLELDEWERNWRTRDLDRPSSGGMGKAYGRQLEQDVSRRRAQLGDARRLLTQAEQREKRLAQRLEEVRAGGGRGRGSSGASRGASRPRQLPSVEEELARMKREMGK